MCAGRYKGATAPGATAMALPDGLAPLRAHNLLTYKSTQEPLGGWALDELLGHYVNDRKLISPRTRLLPASDFQLYAMATRHPRGLAPEERLRGLGPEERLRELAPEELRKLQDYLNTLY